MKLNHWNSIIKSRQDGNETIFKHSVSLVDNIDKITAESEQAKEEIIAVLKSKE